MALLTARRAMVLFVEYTPTLASMVAAVLVGAFMGIMTSFAVMRRARAAYACVGAMAFGLLGVVWRGYVVDLVAACAFGAILLYVSATDLVRREIPHGAVALAVAVRGCCVVASAASAGQSVVFAIGGMLGNGLAVALPLVALAVVVEHASGRDALGGGDVKLAFAAACYLGWIGTCAALAIACVVGLAMAAVMRTRAFPFAPAISAGIWAMMLID